MSTKYLLRTGAAVVATLAVAAYAADMSQVERSLELKDGSVVYMFKDGKMGMEDKNGRPARMKAGEVMDTKDGRKIMMVGDEIMLVEKLKRPEVTR